MPPKSPPVAETVTRYRSGAVARMLRMPVATLRVWERRYGLSQPLLSPSGQRLYDADDVRRLALMKQLTDLGHAIGSLAALDMAQLQAVAATHAGVLADHHAGDRAVVQASPARAWRVAIIGAPLARRLQRLPPQRQLVQAVEWLGPFVDAAQAAQALDGALVDAVLVQEPRLHDGWLATLHAAAPAFALAPKAVLYRFGADATCAALASAGVALLREPQNDTVLVQWLAGLLASASQASAAQDPAPAQPISAVAPRRWDDAALADFAGLSSTIACECPRHVAELLMQLSHFEAYSAECEHRSPADAALHGYLREMTAVARAQFEAALEHVALHEGLTLPAAPMASR